MTVYELQETLKGFQGHCPVVFFNQDGSDSPYSDIESVESIQMRICDYTGDGIDVTKETVCMLTEDQEGVDPR